MDKVSCSMPRGSRIFRQGGEGEGVTEKSFDNAFFSLFFVSNLFDRGGPMVYFKEYYNFPRFQWAGVQHLPEGSNFFSGEGVQLLIPMGTYRTCDIPGGPDPSPPPSGSAHVARTRDPKLLLVA